MPPHLIDLIKGSLLMLPSRPPSIFGHGWQTGPGGWCPAGDRVNGRRGQRAEASQLTGARGQPGEALGPFQLGSPSNYGTWGRDESWTHPSPGKQGGQCRPSWEQMVGGETVSLRAGEIRSLEGGEGLEGDGRESLSMWARWKNCFLDPWMLFGKKHYLADVTKVRWVFWSACPWPVLFSLKAACSSGPALWLGAGFQSQTVWVQVLFTSSLCEPGLDTTSLSLIFSLYAM